MSENTCTIVGNLTRDPEMRFTQTGKAVVSFAVAINRSWTSPDGTKGESVSYKEVKVWNGQAENIANSLVKGDRVIVTGRMEQERWTDEKTNTPRSKDIIIADVVGASLQFRTAKLFKVERVEQAAPKAKKARKAAATK